MNSLFYLKLRTDGGVIQNVTGNNPLNTRRDNVQNVADVENVRGLITG